MSTAPLLDFRVAAARNMLFLIHTDSALLQFPRGRAYLSSPQPDDSDIIPLTKLTVFTEHSSEIRRRGVAFTIKNVVFDVSSHQRLLMRSSTDGADLLPYVLLPIMGPEQYGEEDSEGMLDELQLLPPNKRREKDLEILKTHLETLLILTTTREGRDQLRNVKLYPILRETHIQVEDEGVREACDRIVQVIMRDEAEEAEDHKNMDSAPVQEAEDEDEKIVEIL